MSPPHPNPRFSSQLTPSSGFELWVYMWMSIYSGTVYILGIYKEHIWL